MIAPNWILESPEIRALEAEIITNKAQEKRNQQMNDRLAECMVLLDAARKASEYRFPGLSQAGCLIAATSALPSAKKIGQKAWNLQAAPSLAAILRACKVGAAPMPPRLSIEEVDAYGEKHAETLLSQGWDLVRILNDGAECLTKIIEAQNRLYQAAEAAPALANFTPPKTDTLRQP
jgi:hypothetical protein